MSNVCRYKKKGTLLPVKSVYSLYLYAWTILFILKSNFVMIMFAGFNNYIYLSFKLGRKTNGVHNLWV